jgi:hypothetical protein
MRWCRNMTHKDILTTLPEDLPQLARLQVL